MEHGEGRSVRLVWRLVDDDGSNFDPDGRLEWETSGPWTYALGTFGTMQSLNGMSPWIVRICGRTAGVYRSLDAARRVLERAAHAAGFEVEP